MSNRIGTTASIAGTGVGVVTLVSTVTPEAAGSNLAKWLKILGVDVPSFLNSPYTDTVMRVIGAAILIAVVIYWLYRWRSSHSDAPFWRRREVFSIDEVSEMVSANTARTPARRHRAKYEVTNELTHLIQDGRIPIAGEEKDYMLSVRTLTEGRHRQYPAKTVTSTTLIDRSTIEAVARARGWKLPWF